MPFGMKLATMAVTTAVVIGLANPSSGAPIDDKKAQAKKLATEIDLNGEKISALAESYNGAVYRMEQANLELTQTQTRIDSNETKRQGLKKQIRTRAASVYVQASTGLSNPALDEIANDGSRKIYTSVLNGRDRQFSNELTALNQDLAAQRVELKNKKSAAATEKASISARKSEIEAANQRQRQLLAKVNGEIATLVAQERAARARQLTNRSTGARRGNGNPRNFDLSKLPTPSPRAAVAIEFAKSQLGKPYRYAASGPDAYDCSGLTMRSWGAAGLSLPHYSGAQYRMFPKIPIEALAPGDLVFRGPGGGAHVGLYIGGGLMITAPQTGDVVKIAGAGRIDGAVRPG